MSWWRGSGWISATSSSSSSTIFMGVFCISPHVQTVSPVQVLSAYYSSKYSTFLQTQWQLCPFTHMPETLKLVNNIQLAPACKWVLVTSWWSVERTGRGRVDEQSCNQLANTCMLQQTDASSKQFGGMTLNMKNDPDSKKAWQRGYYTTQISKNPS